MGRMINCRLSVLFCYILFPDNRDDSYCSFYCTVRCETLCTYRGGTEAPVCLTPSTLQRSSISKGARVADKNVSLHELFSGDARLRVAFPPPKHFYNLAVGVGDAERRAPGLCNSA
jgi:hypothetical protein